MEHLILSGSVSTTMLVAQHALQDALKHHILRGGKIGMRGRLALSSLTRRHGATYGTGIYAVPLGNAAIHGN